MSVLRRNNHRKTPSPVMSQDGDGLPLLHRPSSSLEPPSTSSSSSSFGKHVVRRRRTTTRTTKQSWAAAAASSAGTVTMCVLLLGGILLLVGFHHPVTAPHAHKMHAAVVARVLWQQHGQQSPSQQVPQHPLLPPDMDDSTMYDMIVAGAGPAGLTAALFAARAGLRVIVLGSTTGMLSQTQHLDNFPSYVDNEYSGGGGPGWLEITRRQAVEFGAETAPAGLLAKQLERDETYGYFSVKTDEVGDQSSMSSLHAWSVIVASGATPKKLDLPNESLLWGTSIHSCAICDGHLYQNQTVVVVGGGDAAMDAALMLARYARKVVVVHRRRDFSSARNRRNVELVVQNNNNIEIKVPYTVQAWETEPIDNKNGHRGTSNTRLTGVKLLHAEQKQNEEHLAVSGAFVMIGATPNTGWIHNSNMKKAQKDRTAQIDLDDEGLIRLSTATTSSGATTSTSVTGVFAAGEVVDTVYKQAITAAASGAQAAIDAERWLRERIGVTQRQLVLKKHHLKTDSSTKTTGATPSPSLKTRTETLQKSPVKMRAATKENASTDQNEECDMTDPECIQSIAHKHPVVVFSKPWCPYCRMALEALSLAGVSDPHVIDLSKYVNTVQIQATLHQMTGRRTVPNVFVGGSSIGGGDETVAFQRQGKLVSMIQEAKAVLVTKNTDWQDSQDGLSPVKHDVENDNPNDKKGTEMCDLSSEDCFDDIIHKYPVVIFSLAWCPECKRSLELLDRIGVKPHIIDLDDYKPIALDIRGRMKQRTGRNQVPNLWIGGEWVGGFSRTDDYHRRGELLSLLEKAGVLTEKKATA